MTLEVAARVIPPNSVAGVPEPMKMDWDLLFDALSYVGSGSWPALARLVSQFDDSPWAPMAVAKTLSSLGHLDYWVEHPGAEPSGWAITPTTIVAANVDGGYIAGWRSNEMVERARAAVEGLGGTLRSVENESAPATLSIAGLSAAGLESLSTEVTDVSPMVNPALGLAAALPTLADVRPRLRQVPPPAHGEVQRFDPASGAWGDDESPGQPGAFRSRHMPRRHWHYSGADWRATDTYTCRWLAAAERTSLVAYDEETEQVACRLGSEPPGMYERALVLASGRAPRRQGKNARVYAGVPAGVAGLVIARLTGT